MVQSSCAESISQRYQACGVDDQAERQSVAALLNCYLREVAAPSLAFVIGAEEEQRDWPAGLSYAMSSSGGKMLVVRLPEVHARIAVLIRKASASLNFEYLSRPYVKQRDQGWMLLSYRHLATLIIKQLGERYNQPFNVELLLQIENSVEVMRRIIASAPRYPHWGQGSNGFLRSEQSLSFGHPFHPTPKCREGFDADALSAFSPELGASFQLAYFAIRNEDLLQRAVDTRSVNAADRSLKTTDLIAPFMPPELNVPSGFSLVPVHPWQATFLQSQALIKSALQKGRIQWMGAAGGVFYPTASVRTLYQPGNPYFYKGSLHMRLTNCIRKNAFYELESAVELTQLLSKALEGLQGLFPGVHVLYEPAYLTVQFKDLAPSENRLLNEGFGMLFRDAFDASDFNAVTPALAGALFTEDLQGCTPVKVLVDRLAMQHSVRYQDAALIWFDEYLENLLQPLFYCFFRLGVVFEPHLQNVVVGLKDNLPKRVYIRDLEGTKLVTDKWDENQLQNMSPRARDSVLYDANKGWGRVAYCLLANNLFQALNALSSSDAALENALWQRFRDHLKSFQCNYGCAASRSVINGLLNGVPIPYKTNLMTRVFKRADKQSEYVQLQHGLGA